MYLDSALVVGGAPSCSAQLAIDPSLGLKDPQRSTEPFISHKVERTRVLTCG